MYEDCPPFFFFFPSTVHLPVSHVSFAKGHLPKRFGHKKEWEIGCSFWFFFPLSKILAPFAPVPSTLPLRVSILSSIVFFFYKVTCGFWRKEKNYAFLFFFLFLKKKKNSLTPLLILRRKNDAGCDGRGKKENIKHRFVENFSRSFQDARIYSTPL